MFGYTHFRNPLLEALLHRRSWPLRDFITEGTE
jgi:hypothetical protein